MARAMKETTKEWLYMLGLVLCIVLAAYLEGAIPEEPRPPTVEMVTVPNGN